MARESRYTAASLFFRARLREWQMRILIPVVVSLATPLLAQEATLKLAPTPLELPARIGPLVANPTPHKYDKPEMGASWQYSGPGSSLTVYLYDAGIRDLQDGADTIPACLEFEVAKQGALQAYQNSKLVSQNMVRLLPPEGTPLMREAALEMVREGHPVVSYVWITTVAHQFIKLRFTMDQQLRDELPEARRSILEAFGNAIKPHLVAVKPDAEKSGTSIGLDLDSLMGDELGAAGFMYPMLLTAMIEQTPDAAPVCGGEVVPPFETELGLYRSLFIDDEDGRNTKLGRQLAKADEAGFLDELVWMEMHRDAWGDTPPQGQATEDYRAWKKKNLKRFKAPGFGTVTIDHPRPLPMEAETPP
jgi:hypothetical protein